MKKAIKIFLIGIALLILIPVITLFVLSKTHHHTAHQEIVALLNQELEGKVVFKDFNFSYLEHFPQVHAELVDITILDSNSGVSKIGKLDILLNLKSLWSNKLEIEKLIIKDAFLHSEVDSLGNKPHIFSSIKNSPGTRKRSLIIESHDVEIINSRVYIGNMVKGNGLFISVKEGIFNLSVTDSIVLISGNISANLDTLISNHNVLFSGQPVSIKNAVFKIHRSSGEKELINGTIFAHNLELTPRLKMTPHDDGQLIDMHISGEGNFDSFLELFEFHTGFDLKQTNPQAKLSMTYNQHGIVNPFLRPYSEIDFEITNSEFSGSKLPYPVKNFSIKGNYNNGEAHSQETSELVIDTLHAEISDSYVNGRLKLKNLKDPIVDAHLISRVNLSHLIKETDNFSISGAIDIDLILDGKISELKKLHLEGKQVAKGSINVRDLNLILKDKGYKIDLLNGSTTLNNHIFEVTTLVGAFNESAFHFQGIFDNLDQYITNKNEELIGKVNLNFEKLDLNEFNFVESSQDADTSSSKFKLPMIALDLSVAGKEIISDMGVINNFRLNSTINTDNIIINSLAFNYQEGEVNSNAGIFFKQGEIDSVVANITGKFNKLNFEIPSDTAQTEKEKQPFSIPTYIYANINFEIDEGELFSIPVQDLVLKANINGNEVLIPQLTFNAFDGQSNLNGRLHFDNNGLLDVKVSSKLRFDQIDLGKFIKDNDKDKNQKQPSEFAFSDLPSNMDIRVDFFANGIFYKDQTLNDFSADINISDNQININKLSSALPFGNIDLNLRINEIRNDKKINYAGTIDLNLDTLNLDRLLRSEAMGLPNENTGKGNTPSSTKKEKHSFTFPSNLELTLNSKAHRIYYKNGRVDDLDLTLIYSSEKVDLKKLDFFFAGGHVSTHGYVLKNNSESFPAYVFSRADSIDLQDLLESFNNFNQDIFNTENSSGTISWNSDLHFNFKSSFFPVTHDNIWKFEFMIHNAEFRNIAPIEKALFFIGHKAKDDLIVKDLDVNAFLYDDKIFFKDVFMNDNIADLDLFGEIDLADSLIDIGIEVSLSDLFFRSKKERVVETRDGEVHLDKDLKVFLKMEGPLSEHKIKMSSKRKFKKHRKNLANTIEQAEREIKKKEQKN